ncbi:MAG TPA: methyltransferase domain-containing protein [Gemmatimonadaceae bacterium]|nr:methyltransferase domain-containing protein [Gemmatimonadaceae bacterium]
MSEVDKNVQAMDGQAEFDAYEEGYDDALNKGLAVSGESKDYFARERIRWLHSRLVERGVRPRRVLDFGCGEGGSIPWFRVQLEPERLVGVDVSAGLLRAAARQHPDSGATLMLAEELPATPEFDLAFCNGVFHHIPLAERAGAVDYVFQRLRPGGLFAFWENNPWNPGTRYVMSRIPFDRDAITLTPPEAAQLLERGGFRVVRRDFCFFFPRVLALLRPTERLLSRVPLGAQYLVLGEKP